MKLFATMAAVLAVMPTALAVDQMKSAIVMFENDATPDSVVDQVKQDLINAGGRITHIYNIIRGFSVTAPKKALEAVQVLSTKHSIKIEEDEMVSTDAK